MLCTVRCLDSEGDLEQEVSHLCPHSARAYTDSKLASLFQPLLSTVSHLFFLIFKDNWYLI